MKSIAVIDVMLSSSPSFAGLYENATGVTVATMLGVIAYSAETPTRTWNMPSAPSVSRLAVNGLSLTPLKNSPPTPTSPRTPSLGIARYVAPTFATRPSNSADLLAPITSRNGTGVNVNPAPTSTVIL